MNASTAKIIGIVLIVLLAVGFLKFLVAVPFGIIGGLFHGERHDWSGGGDWWFWPVAGFGGLLALLYLAVAVWILFWVYKDAQSRGMNGALWVILVFFLHLVGLVVYLLVRSGYPVRKPESPTGAQAAPPQPATAPPASSAGAPPASPAPPIPSAAPPVPTVPPAPPDCSRCGRPLQNDWVACPHCGERV